MMLIYTNKYGVVVIVVNHITDECYECHYPGYLNPLRLTMYYINQEYEIVSKIFEDALTINENECLIKEGDIK